MDHAADFTFNVPFSSDQVDEASSTIRGVALITGDLEAEGHGLHVDDTTLKQIHQFAKSRGKVTVKMDHKGADGRTFKAIVGYLTNFRVAGKKVRGDFELLEKEPLTPKILEMARRMPECFGLSVAFKGKGVKGDGGKQFARCDKLLSADLVENPAANPDGLFSARPVDTQKNAMSQNGTPTLEDLHKLLTTVVEQQQQINQRLDAVEAANVTPEDYAARLEHLNGLDDAELEQLGITRDEIAAEMGIVQQVLAEGADDATRSADATVTPGAQPSAAAPAAVASPAAATAMHALQQEIISLRAKFEAKEASELQAQEDHALSVIEAKANALIAENNRLTQLSATQDAEIKSLRATLKSGTRAAAPGGEGVTLFSAKGAADGTFEQLVTVKFNELMQQKDMTEVKARAQAVEFCVRKHTDAYRDYRSRGGKIELSAK